MVAPLDWGFCIAIEVIGLCTATPAGFTDDFWHAVTVSNRMQKVIAKVFIVRFFAFELVDVKVV